MSLTRPAYLAPLAAVLLSAAPLRAQHRPPTAAPAPPPDAAPIPRAPALRIIYTADLVFRLGPGTRSCPTEDYLHQEVARQLGYDPLVPDPQREPIGRFEVEITHPPKGFTARVKRIKLDGSVPWNEPEGNYELCKDLFKAVAFTIAMELTVHAAEEQPLEEEPPPAPTPAAPAPAPPAAPEPKPEPKPVPSVQIEPSPVPATPEPSAFRLRLQIGASLLGVFGTAPSPTVGGALHVGVLLLPRASRPLSFSLALEGRADAPAGDPANKFTTGLFAGSALACFHLDASVLNGVLGYPFACVVGTRGKLAAAFERVDGSTSVDRAYAGLGGRFGFEARLAPFASLLAQGELRGTARSAYVATGSGRAAWSTPSVSAEVGLGALFSFDLVGR